MAEPARVFSALGDPVRLALLDRLAWGEARPQGVLVAGLELSRQGATKHLAVLEAAGLVTSETRGRERHLRLVPGGLALASDHLARLSTAWCERLGRLKARVEGGAGPL